MRIALLGFGSRGDVQPFAVLGRALAARGHDVWLAAPEDADGFVRQCGLPYRRLAGNVRALVESDEGKRLLASGSVIEFSKRMLAQMALIRDELDDTVTAAVDNADVVITHALIADRAASVCEKTGTARLVVIHTVPLQPTREFSCPIMGLRDLPVGALNKLTGNLFWAIYLRGARNDLNRLRTKLGLPAVTHSPWASLDAAQIPSLCIVSPHVVPRPNDWPAWHRMSGALVADQAMREGLGECGVAPAVEAFLAAGSAPYFIGFGSMPVTDPPAMLRLTLTALSRIDARAIIGAGWSSLPGADDPRLCIVGAVDHDAVLPRCAGMVHHGGAGTTSAAMRAGIPAAVFSVFSDQPFWGKRVVQLGVGVHHRFQALDADRLAGALQALRDPVVMTRARALAAALRDEDGITNAIDVIEGVAPHRPVPRLA